MQNFQKRIGKLKMCGIYGWKANLKCRLSQEIKVWSSSESNEKTERTNPKNGLCLNALHDKAFDRGLTTLNCNYEMIVSSQ